MRVAIVHDWLTERAGAEAVLAEILALYPEATLFVVCDFLPEAQRQFLKEREVITSFIQKFPGARRHYRSLLPLMPLAVEQFDLSAYDLIISSSHAVAKGVITGPEQLHVAYVHSPMRYAWDLQHQYLRDAKLDRGVRGWFARWALHRLRMWDFRTAAGVDYFIANSQFVSERIRKIYRRTATVIPPPVDTNYYVPGYQRGDHYLAASRMVPYKRIDMIISAFRAMPDRQLVVIGDGPERKRLERMAPGNVDFLGRQPASRLRGEMQRAAAFIFAAEEDFGIMPVEAQACGTPVLAYNRGGSRETVKDGVTGLFFDEQTPSAIAETVRTFEGIRTTFEASVIRNHAQHFSSEVFREKFSTFVGEACAEAGLTPRKGVRK